MKPHLAIVVPVYNEAEGIGHFHAALSAELARISGYDTTILYVVDGATDESFSLLREIAATEKNVQIIKLSRNFGHQAALLAGIDHADADALITMDADMQHPPELIPQLLAAYEKGNDVVYTFRENSDDIGWLRHIAGNIFYRLINIISDVPINRNSSDFRLISRRIADLLRNRLRERNMFIRGIMSWVGFKQAKVAYKASDRFAGKGKFSLSRNIQFATFGIISFSKKPLRAATVMGFVFSVLGFCFALYAVIEHFTNPALVPGWATTTVLLSIFGGIQLFFLGVIGEYIGAIFDEVKARPPYLVEDSVGIEARQ